PHTLLTHITQRATHVWQHQPHRLPAPRNATHDDTHPASSAVSRRTLLKFGGGAAAGVAAVGAGIWTWLDRGSGNDARAADAASPAPQVSKLPGSLWTRRISRNSQEIHTTPLLAGECLSITTTEGLIGFNAKTGEDMWLQKELLSAGSVATDGVRIYAVAPPEPGRLQLALCTVDLVRGSLDPVVVLPDFNSALKNGRVLCVSGGTAFLVAGQGETDAGASWYLIAAGLASGKELWRSELGALENPALKSFYAARSLGGSFLMTVGDSVNETLLKCYDAGTGKLRWTVEPGYALTDGIVMDEEHVYLGANSSALENRHQVVSLRVTDGRTVWEYGKDVPQDLPGPVLHGGMLYTMRYDGIITAIDAAKGNLVWESSPVPARYGVSFVTDRDLYVIGESGLEVIDTRSQRTRKTLTMPQDASFIPDDNGMFIAAQTDLIAGFPTA
ncbi:outer membrane protein assembly factor BamB family protein, partial [Streptomyces xantholiticus]|uniref:outer membrane protein assembly factor BamB family protein n=1 Tax=Streptomyces xantholiticus TaxID=68285 RepID=UPI001E351CFC